MAPPKKKRKMSKAEEKNKRWRKGKKELKNEKKVLEVDKHSRCQQNEKRRNMSAGIRQGCNFRVLVRPSTKLRKP